MVRPWAINLYPFGNDGMTVVLGVFRWRSQFLYRICIYLRLIQIGPIALWGKLNNRGNVNGIYVRWRDFGNPRVSHTVGCYLLTAWRFRAVLVRGFPVILDSRFYFLVYSF